MAIDFALGTNWRRSATRFAPSVPVMKATPVIFAPGRLMLATSPSLTGSLPVVKTIGIVAPAVFAASAERVFATNYLHREPNKFGGQRRQLVELMLAPAEFDRYILTLDKVCFLQPLSEGRQILGLHRRLAAVEEADDGERLLRPRHHRPRHRPEQRVRVQR